MEIAADARLLHLKFTRAEGLGGAAHRVIPWLIEISHEMRVEANLRRKELGIDGWSLGSRSAVQPSEIGVCEGGLIIYARCGIRGFQRLGECVLRRRCRRSSTRG